MVLGLRALGAWDPGEISRGHVRPAPAAAHQVENARQQRLGSQKPPPR